MQWNDEAIILSARKFGESGLLVEVFAKSKGLCSALVRGGQSKKQVSTFQPGNIIDVTWRGRLEEQLGTFTAEVVDAISAKVITEPLKLQAVISLTSLLRKTLIDSHPYTDLYTHYREFFASVPHDDVWLDQYVWMEIALLQYLGFGLDLTECAVTGATTGLSYLSPRTGRAVTNEGAAGYQDRLLTLPPFLAGENHFDNTEILTALEITEFFMNKNFFAPHDRKIPAERDRLVQMLKRHFQSQLIA